MSCYCCDYIILEKMEKDYKRLEKKLFSMCKESKGDLYDFNIEDMAIKQLKERQNVLKQNLYEAYSKRQYIEYKEISKALNDRYINSKMEFIYKQLETETEKYLRLLLGTLANERHVHQGFEESYLYLKITLIKKMIKCLEKDMIKNQDMVNEVIKYIKKESKKD